MENNTKYNVRNQVFCETISVFKNLLHMNQVLCLVQFTAEPYMRLNWPNFANIDLECIYNSATAEQSDGQHSRDNLVLHSMNYISQNLE